MLEASLCYDYVHRVLKIPSSTVMHLLKLHDMSILITAYLCKRHIYVYVFILDADFNSRSYVCFKHYFINI